MVHQRKISISSIGILFPPDDGSQDDQSSSSSSCISEQVTDSESEADDQHERWERKRRPSDTRPGMPCRQASQASHLKFIESNAQLLSERNSGIPSFHDSGTSFDSTIATEPEVLCDYPCSPQKVTRSISNDSLPHRPERQASGRHLQLNSTPPSVRRTRRSERAAIAAKKRRMPPTIPRRQPSGTGQRVLLRVQQAPALVKSNSAPLLSTRVDPAFTKPCAGYAA